MLIMTAEKIKAVLAIYRKKFEELGIPKEQFTQNSYVISDIQCLTHCHSMLSKIDVFLNENRMDKSFR